MGDIVHIAFGSRQPGKVDDWHPLEVVGHAAGYVVGFVREKSTEGPMIRVVVGQVGGNAIESVALVPDHPGRFDDALNCAVAVLRTLEIVL